VTPRPSRLCGRMRIAMLAFAVLGPCLLAPPALAARHLGQRTLRQGARGHDVRVLQDYLTRIELPTPVTGYFGSITKRNVKRFERRNHLRANGVLTRGQARVLRRLADSQPASTPTTGGAQSTALPAPAGKARLNPDGTATAPVGAPAQVQAAIAAGNQIAFKPYVYGGGHGSWIASGYDCSGSVSYALHGGGLLNQPRDSTGFESYGSAGRGQWITIFANAGHAYMVVAGLRFDTSGLSADGSRWHTSSRSASGYVVRHPTGF
jgi:peptidoglycan hydrolase-like protein with peptidoglycan-binding domain